MISSTSVWVITAIAPDRAAEGPKEPVSPMKIERREGVVPEESDAGADQAAAEQRQVPSGRWRTNRRRSRL